MLIKNTFSIKKLSDFMFFFLITKMVEGKKHILTIGQGAIGMQEDQQRLFLSHFVLTHVLL